MYNFTG
jgi:hypothetical protein